MSLSPIDIMAFQLRLQDAVKSAGGNNAVANKSGIPLATLNNYLSGKSEPTISRLFAIAKACNVSLDELVGLSNPRYGTEDMVSIPRYDAHLSAGTGHWNEDNVTVIDHIPFTREFINKKLDRESANDLLILETRGDSMLPTISDRDLVLVDKRAQSRADGIFAYVQDGMARVKRFKFMPGGKVQIVSDNSAVYTPETYSNEEMEQLDIIGRVRWIGHTV